MGTPHQPPHLAGALKRVVGWELETKVVADRVFPQSLQVVLGKLASPWQKSCRDALRERTALLAQQQLNRARDLVEETITQISQNHAMGAMEEESLRALSEDSQGALRKGDWHVTLNNFMQSTRVWEELAREWDQARKAAEALLRHAGELQTATEAQRAALDKLRTETTTKLGQARQRLDAAGKDADYGKVMIPIVDHLNARFSELEALISGCSNRDLDGRLDRLAGSLGDIDTERVVAACRPFFVILTQCGYAADSASTGAGLFAALRQTNKPYLTERLAMLLAAFGPHGFFALCNLPGSEQVALLDRWPAVGQTLSKKGLDAHCAVPLLQRYFSLAAGGHDAKDGVIAVLGAADEKPIDVASHVTALGWQVVSGMRFPQAFTTKSKVTTDSACIKHVAQETGGKPSHKKLSDYFAEMVSACEEAHHRWKQTGASYHTVQQPGATWNIIVNGKGEIFHIDSGYEKSGWVHV